MPKGILIFGANGSGKTTLARQLALELNYKSMDVEDYYFEKSDIPYSKPRKKDEVIQLMLSDIERYDTFVLSAVTGDFGEKIISMYRLAVFLSVPLDIRMMRIKNREKEKYGERVLLGGDMYEQNQRFLEFAKTRNLVDIDAFSGKLTCSVIRLNGEDDVFKNIEFIIKEYKGVLSHE